MPTWLRQMLAISYPARQSVDNFNTEKFKVLEELNRVTPLKGHFSETTELMPQESNCFLVNIIQWKYKAS